MTAKELALKIYTDRAPLEKPISISKDRLEESIDHLVDMHFPAPQVVRLQYENEWFKRDLRHLLASVDVY